MAVSYFTMGKSFYLIRQSHIMHTKDEYSLKLHIVLFHLDAVCFIILFWREVMESMTADSFGKVLFLAKYFLFSISTK